MSSLSGEPVGLVLAAGKSERLGTDKLFAPIGGQAVVERVVAALLGASRVTDVVVVVPTGAVERFSWLRSVRVHLVENPDPERGMISSIRVGLRTTWAAERDILISPADVPFLKPEIVDKVVHAFMTRDCRIVIPTYKGLGGHPGMYAASLRDDFFLHGDVQGAREIILRHGKETVRLRVHDPDVCFDIDTDEDLAIAGDAGARWARVEKDLERRRGH